MKGGGCFLFLQQMTDALCQIRKYVIILQIPKVKEDV